jgi:hypothetical protein
MKPEEPTKSIFPLRLCGFAALRFQGEGNVVVVGAARIGQLLGVHSNY